VIDRAASFEPEAPPRVPRGRAVALGADRTSRLLDLQRAAGNAAVGRVLARTPQSDTLTALKATKGYQALSAAEKARLDVLIGGGTSLSTHAWPHMKALLEKPGTNKDLAKTFQDFVAGTSWLNFDVRLPGEKRLPTKPLTMEAPVDVAAHPFRSGAADARKCVVKIEGTWPDGTKETFTIPIYAPKSFTPPAPGRVLPSEGDMAKVLAEVPIQTLSRITQINLDPKRNPDDATWEADPKYNPSGTPFYSHMTPSVTGVISVYPSPSNADLKEIETTLIHEAGHSIAGRVWGYDNSDAKWDRWKRARTADGISISRYANSSDNEDFAESWMLFATAYGTPLEAEVRTLIPNRCAIMDEFVLHKKPPPPAPPAAKPPPTPAPAAGVTPPPPPVPTR
jgi:hypothetical protein